MLCHPHVQGMIREKARASGKTVSGYLLEPARDDDRVILPLALSPEHQQEILEGTRILQKMTRALRRELPGAEGLGFLRQ